MIAPGWLFGGQFEIHISQNFFSGRFDDDGDAGNDDDGDDAGNDDDDDVDDDHREERTLKATWPGLFPDPLDPVRRAWPLSQRGKQHTAQMYNCTLT